MTIEIIGKLKGTQEVLDDANNQHQAKQSVDYWKKLKGSKWKISTKVKK